MANRDYKIVKDGNVYFVYNPQGKHIATADTEALAKQAVDFDEEDNDNGK